jgi:integrase
MANGKRHVTRLGVRVGGRNIPLSLKAPGDTAFEQSRGAAQLALDNVIAQSMSRKAASAQLEQLYEIRTGEKVGKIPLDEMVAAWKKAPHPRDRSPRYVDQSETTIKAFIAFMKANYPVAASMDRVNRGMAEAWMASLGAKKGCPATYNDKLVLLRSVFKLLRHDAGMAWNPFETIPTKTRHTTHRRPFTPEELTAILKEADPLVRPVIITGIFTAMRRGDCCLLRWADVDLKAGYVVVKTGKTGETAEIPIFPMLADELRKADAARTPNAEGAEYVWPEAAKMFLTNRYGITYRTNLAIENAKIEETDAPSHGTRNISVKDFHSFRTTWITLALSAGVPMELVRRVTGHTTTDVVLKHYFRPGREDFKKTLQSAMPKMLTQAAIDVDSAGVPAKPPTPDEVLDQALKALKGLTAKNLKKQRKAVATLIEQAKELIAQSAPDKSSGLTGATLAPAKALPVAAA